MLRNVSFFKLKNSIQSSYFFARYQSVHLSYCQNKSNYFITNMSNILGVNLYADQCLPKMISSLKSAFSTGFSLEKIEIEIKYAEFTFFCGNFDEAAFKGVNPQAMKRIYQLYKYQQDSFFRGLGILSRQNLVYLNPLGKDVYTLLSRFHEPTHKRFYHMREFLTKVCRYNEQNNYEVNLQPSNLVKEPKNIYFQFSVNSGCHLLKMVEENEIRMDIFIKEIHNQALAGRYSYSTKTGWKLTKKTQFCPQIDFMLNEKPFRMAINNESEVDVLPKGVQLIAEYLKNFWSAGQIRIKRQMRVTKGDICEFSLSEVYNFDEKTKAMLCPIMFGKLLTQKKENFDIYLRRVFINFYSIHERQNSHFEIQSEISKQMANKLKVLLTLDQSSEVEKIIENMIGDLYALYYCEHATKGKEMGWLSKKVKDAPKARLENQHGGYMRDILYELMNQQ